MKFNTFLVNENMVDTAISYIRRLDFRKAKDFFKDQFDEFVHMVQTAGLEPEVIKVINKGFGTRYSSLEQIRRERIKESGELNEDLAHWWKVVKDEGFPTLAFYPMLTVWMELDKIFQGQDINVKKVIVYSLFFVLIVSGKYVKGWMTWKKQNPEEYASERAHGKGGII